MTPDEKEVMKDLIIALFPELLEFLKSFQNTNGRLPTIEELTNEVYANENKYIKIGEDWLAKHTSQG